MKIAGVKIERAKQTALCSFLVFYYFCTTMTEFLATYNLTGLAIGVATFLIIGLFHPLVIKGEYHFGVGCWWVFLVMGLMSIVGSVMVHDIFFSTLLAVWGASSLWSIGELFHQRKRVERGWFPANPKRQRKA